jgi:DNA replication protein DnaC
LTRICIHCGKKVEPVEFEVFGQKRLVPGSCPCEEKIIEAQLKERRQLEKKQKIEKLFGQSQLGPKFSKAIFENWEQMPGTQTAFREAVNYVKEQRYKKGEGLLFFGRPGNGKSHLAAAIVNSVIPQNVAAVFQVVPELLKKIQGTYRSRDKVDETVILNTLCDADLVVLDDLGAERLTDWTQEKIYQVINSLYINEKPVIITTNVNLETEFEDRVGARIYDRVIEMCRLVEIKGWSYRQKIAERRLKSIGGDN